MPRIIEQSMIEVIGPCGQKMCFPGETYLSSVERETLIRPRKCGPYIGWLNSYPFDGYNIGKIHKWSK